MTEVADFRGAFSADAAASGRCFPTGPTSFLHLNVVVPPKFK